MASLALAALAFVLIHLGVSGTALRDTLVARLGLRGYMPLFSVLSVAAIVWLVSAYKAAPYEPTWGQLEWWKPVMIALMLILPNGLLSIRPLSWRKRGRPLVWRRS